MKYLLAIYGDEKQTENIPPEQMGEFMDGWFKFDEQLRSSYKVEGGEGLEPTSAATTVRVQDGNVVTSDGPFAETKEQLGGFYLIDAENLDEAIAAASSIPNLQMGGSVEVRPVQVFEQP